MTLFPAYAVWNLPVDTAPLHSLNDRWIDIANGHAGHPLHPDFGTVYNGFINGIPTNEIYGNSVPLVPVTITTYAGQSDPVPTGGLPIPTGVVIGGDYPTGPAPEDGSNDQHCLILDLDTNRLHEFYHMTRNGDNTYQARQYSTWDVTSNNLRQNGWTSADAAGLPLSPFLVRYDEVATAVATTGVVPHAFRFTLDLSSPSYLWPARHYAGSGGPLNPPMGMRVRIKANYDISGFSATNQAILRTLKKYGMILADNGGDWFINGSPDSRWDDGDLHNITAITPVDAFEVVDTSYWQVSPDSAEADPTLPIRDIRILDQFDAGVDLQGNFASRLSGDWGGYHSLFVYAYPDNTGNTYVSYNFTGLTAGRPYLVAYTWPNYSGWATNAPWAISDGVTTLGAGTLDLTVAPSDFTDTQTGFVGKELGIFTPNSTELTFTLNGNANNFVIADAMWVEGLPTVQLLGRV
jgi:hypothetical protein